MRWNFMNRNGCYIDLHAHLDGSVTVDIAKKLAALQNIALPTDNDEELLALLSVPDSCESLNDFLQCFELPGRLMQTPEGLQNAVTLVLENMAQDGVIYAELRFAPQFHTLGGMTQEQAVQAAVAGLKNAPIPGNLILCCMRGEGNEKANEETLAGAEALFPTVNYLGLFEEAKEAGIPYTVHAGEADGPESVRTAIQTGTKRIGHGVRSMEDEAVMELIREKGITLEMCPTSNRQTHAILDMKQYPLVRFLESGIRVTVNTDDMGIERTCLSKEFDYLKREFGLTEEQQKQVVLNAADAAFASEETKKMLREMAATNSRLMIEEVGVQCGFRSRSVFFTRFNGYEKMTPRKYMSMFEKKREGDAERIKRRNG